MMITNATIQEIPRSLGISTGARVPSPKMPSDQSVSIGNSDDTQSRTNESGPVTNEKAAKSAETPATNETSFKLVEGGEVLQKPQEVEDEKPALEEEVDREGFAELAEDLTTRMSGNLRIKFLTDETTGRDYFQLIEKETGEVIRQYPPDEMLRLAEKFQDVSSLIFSSQV